MLAKTKFPSPKAWPLIGHAHYLVKGEGGCVFHALDKLRQQYGAIFQLKVAGKVWVVVADAELIKNILVTDYQKFPKGETLDEAKALGIGAEGITETEGEAWLQQHKILFPYFTKEFSQKFQGLAKKLALGLGEELKDKKIVDIQEVMNSLSLGFIQSVLLPSSYKIEEKQKRADFLTQQDFITQEFLKRLQWGPWRKKLPLFSNWKLKKSVLAHRKNIGDGIHEQIKDEQATLVTKIYQSLNERGKPYSHDQLVDQIYTLIGAAFESTAATLHWFVYFVGQQSKLLETLREQENRTLLKYCLMETMRLRPPFPILSRQAQASYTWQTKEIPSKALTLCLVGSVHRDKDLWGDDADQFNPRRFENLSQQDLTQYYFPFGLGPRKCIGEELAWVELYEVSEYLVKHFDWKVDHTHKVIPYLQLAYGSKNGIRVEFFPISSSFD